MDHKLRTMTVTILLIAGCVALIAENALANTIMSDQIILEIDTETKIFELDEVKYETDESGNTKICLCRELCFRALQTLATRFEKGIVPRDDIQIITGWTTHGPEELFVEVMEWPTEDVQFMTNATNEAHLTEEDAVFFFIQKSTGKAWKIAAREGLYPLQFFTYRTLFKTAETNSEQINFFKTVLRPQANINLSSLPMVDKFDVEQVLWFGKDGSLRIPTAIVNGTAIHDAKLQIREDGAFDLISVDSSN